MLEIVSSTDLNEIIASMRDHVTNGAHFTNGTYAYPTKLVVPTVLAGFRHPLSLYPHLPLVIAVNSDESMRRIGKLGQDKEMVRALKVAEPLAEMYPNNKVIVLFYDEETPNELYAALNANLKQPDQVWTLHKWGYGTKPDAPKIEGVNNFDFVFGYPMPNNTLPICWNETPLADELQNIKIVDLPDLRITIDGVLFEVPASLKQYQSSLFSEEKAQHAQETKVSHFFDLRTIEKSLTGNSWRYGRNNVFSPSIDPTESENAIKNTDRILQEYGLSECRAVMLESQYGNEVTTVTESFFSDAAQKRDSSGRIIVEGDGLFTTLPDVVLLNKSGDAHAVILESKGATGIFVGSWHCVRKGIIKNMMACFKAAGIEPNDITLRVGPGLGARSYSVGQDMYDQFSAENPAWLEALTLKNDGRPGKSGKIKYLFDFPKFLKIAAANYDITSVVIDESEDTFDKPAWKGVKAEATESGDPKKIMSFYADQTFFGARLYTRVDRQIRRICAGQGLDLPEGMQEEKATYGGTGRNLNGVRLRR